MFLKLYPHMPLKKQSCKGFSISHQYLLVGRPNFINWHVFEHGQYSVYSSACTTYSVRLKNPPTEHQNTQYFPKKCFPTERLSLIPKFIPRRLLVLDGGWWNGVGTRSARVGARKNSPPNRAEKTGQCGSIWRTTYQNAHTSLLLLFPYRTCNAGSTPPSGLGAIKPRDSKFWAEFNRTFVEMDCNWLFAIINAYAILQVRVSHVLIQWVFQQDIDAYGFEAGTDQIIDPGLVWNGGGIVEAGVIE